MLADRVSTRAGSHAAWLAVLMASLCVSLWFVPAAASSQAESPKRVLVLYWYSKDFPGNVAFDRSFQPALQSASRGPVEYFAEYFETNRFPGENQAQWLHDYLRQKYAALPIDVVVASGYASQDFLLKFRKTLFPAAPLVFVGSDQPEASTRLAGAGATGIVTYTTHRKTLDLALKLHPDTEQVFVISGTIDRDRRFESVARQALRALEDKIAVHYLTDLPLDELVVRTRTLPQRSIVLYVWQQSQTVDGRLLESADVLAAIAPSTHVPIYGMSAANIGTGMIGGHVFTLEGIGARAAEITLRILDGDRAADIPVEGAPTVLMFDWRQLERWGIQEDRLPPGSLFQFREPSFWRQYRWFIVGALAVGLIQAALIAGLLIQRSRRRRAELEAQMQQRELTHLARLAMLGELTGTLAHQLRQPLTAIMASAQAARRFLARQPVLQNELQECLEAIIQADDHAASVIQSTQGLLKKRIAPRQPVDLNTVVHDATRVVGSDLALRPIGITSALTPDLPAVLGQRVELQQVVLNLILNACDAMKGLGPERRTVTVSTELTQTGAVQVSVADQGTGIPLDSVARIFEPFFTLKEQGLGLGLTICRTIITAHGGQIWATPNTDVGATFSFTLPPDPTSRRRVRARAGAPNSDDVAAAVE